ncbi:MAG: tRNA lysidine(34) synthetase TilS [Polaromonas sp.]|nr:tRNA lysidine(34) synthetase TilS [Polaromonas sp.]
MTAGPDLPNPALAALAALETSGVFSPPSLIGVAYSGGADSTALLLAAAQCWPGRVTAVHIHHGLQAAADDFVRVCEATCGRLGMALEVVHVQAGHAPGQSPEDAARLARYTALAQAAASLNLSGMLLGQHADDQVETLLLALSRGAGLPGLSGMAARFERGGAVFYRPLLQVPATALRKWLLQAGAPFVDDPSNTDERYTRNRIRARLLPALDGAFPQFRETFARSAQHIAQAQSLLVELAREDLRAVSTPPVIRALQGLSAARQANVLRHWLLVAHQATPSAAQLEQLLGQVAACTTRGHQIRLKVATGQVSRDGDCLAYAAATD